ncbi:FAD-binding oxidoreductase [Candidatus Hepatincolaceae symbiont of Richtersius coronifer]
MPKTLSTTNRLNHIDTFKAKATEIVGEANVIMGAAGVKENLLKEFLKEQRGNFNSQCLAVVMPNSTIEAAQIVSLCNQYEVAMVPQGGNTGLVGGSVAQENQIILSSRNLSKILAIDPKNHSLIAQSGVVLQDLQTYAKNHNLFFPLQLPSQKWCTIGGNFATNAGGTNVIKYGLTRDLALGIEVVLPNGHIYSDLNILRKRNIGPELKHLFIGGEGSLGFITAVACKLFPCVPRKIHILAGLTDSSHLDEVFVKLYDKFFSFISAYEIFNQNAVDMVLNNCKDIYFPLNQKLTKHDKSWYILITLDLPVKDQDFFNYIFALVNANLKDNKNLNDYIISEEEKIWDLRYNIPQAQNLSGPSLKHDISLPISKINHFLKNMLDQLQLHYPGQLKPVVFGHMGDGNLHFNISQASNNNLASNNLKQELILPHTNFKNLKSEIKKVIIEHTMALNGTFSAEHGIGLIHKIEMENLYKEQVQSIKMLKELFDPNNLFNPNKIIGK